MAKSLKILSVASLSAFLGVLAVYFFYKNGVLLSVLITLGTVTYHLLMRLAVGYAVNAICKNALNYEAWWFRPRPWEQKLYEFLKVKRWKGKMPTFAPDTFDSRKRTFKQIAGATCQAEVVHEIIIVLSFLPLFFIPIFGAWLAFVLTSVLSALYDGVFVVMQRFNRPRIVRLAKKEKF